MKTSADELLRFMLANLRLASYDSTALTNFWYTRVSKGLPLTTNQDALFRKMVKTYHRQLMHLGINTNKLADLAWTRPPVESSADYQTARINLVGDALTVKTPFHKKFVDAMSVQPHLKWTKTEKQYVGKFSPVALKVVYVLTKTYFDHIEWSPELQTLIQSFSDYDPRIDWVLTARLMGDNIIISGLADRLDTILPSLLPADIRTASILQNLGITIHGDVIDFVAANDTEKTLLSGRIVSIERTHLAEVLSFLTKTNCDFVHSEFPEKSNIAKTIRTWAIANSVRSNIKGTGIALYEPISSAKVYEHPVYLHYTSSKSDNYHTPLFARLIKITDSTPINLYA